MATALEKLTNIATGNVNKEDVFGETGTVQLPETLTNVPETPIEDESPLDLADETAKQATIEAASTDVVDDVAANKAGLDSQLEENKTPEPEAPAVTTQTGLTEKLTNQLEELTGKPGAVKEALEDEGVSESEKELADLNTQIASLSAEFDQLSGAQEGRGRTKIFTKGRQAQIQRQKAVVLGGKATQALALQGNIEAARARAQETVDLAFGDLEQRIANTRELLEINEPDYTAAQNKEAAALKRKLDREDTEIEAKKDFIMKVAENGGFSVLEDVLNASRTGGIEDMITAAGKFVLDAEDQETTSEAFKNLTPSQQLQATNLMVKITKGKGTTEYKEGISNAIAEMMAQGKTLDNIEDEIRFSSVSPLFRKSFERPFGAAVIGMSGTARDAARDTLDEFIEVGDFEGAKEHIFTLTRRNSSTTDQSKLSGKEEANIAIDEIESALKEYVDNGGTTNLLSGKIEEFNNNVLKQTGDSTLAEIANRIALAIQSYRQAISGAAFTKDESKEYQRVYPSIGNTPELNEAKINALRKNNQLFIDNFFKRQLGTSVFNDLNNLTEDQVLGIESPRTQIDNFIRDNNDFFESDIAPLIESENLDEEDTLNLIKLLTGQDFSQAGSSVSPTDRSVARTDRHNNPTAFTIDIAKQGGLIEGVDYQVGDVFPNNPNQKTALLIGDPVEQTIKVIDNIGFFTQRGQQRWTHTAMSKAKWDNLSRRQKKQIIKQMYQREGNDGLLNNALA
jgi:hypothetical protein